MFVSAIVAAGGRGQRIGSAVPKQLLVVGGQSILERSVGAFLSHPEIDEIVVALPSDLAAAPPPYLLGTRKPVRVVSGGSRRQDSVAKPFTVLSSLCGAVVGPDAARPPAPAGPNCRTV